MISILLDGRFFLKDEKLSQKTNILLYNKYICCSYTGDNGDKFLKFFLTQKIKNMRIVKNSKKNIKNR